MTNHVEGKSIIITGAGGGFGKLVSEKAAALGGKITCADIDPAAAEAVAASIRANGGAARSAGVDVRDIGQMKGLATSTVAEFGAIDVMVNNVGFTTPGFLGELTDDAWHAVLNGNLSSTFYGIRAALRPRRISLSSIMSSWMRAAAWKNSTAHPLGNARNGSPPTASQASMAIAGRTRLPPRATNSWRMS